MSYRHHSIINTHSTRTSWRLGVVAGVVLIARLGYALHIDTAAEREPSSLDPAVQNSRVLAAARAAYAQGQIDALEGVLTGTGGMQLAEACAALRHADRAEVLP